MNRSGSCSTLRRWGVRPPRRSWQSLWKKVPANLRNGLSAPSERVIIKTSHDFELDASEAEQALAALAREVELPALAQKLDRDKPTPSAQWATGLLVASLACNVMILVITCWSLWKLAKSPDAVSTLGLNQVAVGAIAERVKNDVNTAINPLSTKIDSLRPPTLDGEALQNALEKALQTKELASSIRNAVKENLGGMPLDYNRLKNQNEILTALEAIHTKPGGYDGGDQKLAERLAIEFEKKK